MASVLAIVSKAAFEQIGKDAAVGTVLPFDRYASTHKSLDTLAEGGSLYLVTVRPPDEALWLVGVLDAPAKKKDGWYATNASPIADVTPLVKKLKFSTGKGISANKGALAMSLQTPRVLTDDDVALLRGPAPAKKKTVAAKTAAKKPVAKTTAQPFDLQAIADAIDDGDGAAALEAALVAWRQTNAPALADLIDAISKQISGAPVETDGEFTLLAANHDPSCVGRLVPAIRELPVSFLPAAGEMLAGFPDDPRIASAIAAWALDPPTTSSSTYPFWTATLGYLGKSGDTRAIAVIKQRLKKAKGGSQFWPKFYKALQKTVAKLEEVQVVPVDHKAIGKLVKAAASLEVVAPVVKNKPKVTQAPKLEGPPLDQAAKHLEAGRVQAAIDAMLVAWRELDRVPAIADAIDRATKLLPSWEQPLGATDKAIAVAWQAAFDDDPQAAMPQLLDNLTIGGSAIAEKQLLALGGLPEDPRIGMRLAELAAGHVASPERTQFWKSLFEQVARIRDPRTATALCRSFDDFTGTYYNHHRQARRIIGAWAQNPPVPPQLGPKDAAALDAIAKQLGTLEAKRDTTERDLVNAIVDAWDDTGPRLVYADWLAERQHPRGELIVLACKAKLSEAEAKRLDQLRHLGSLYGVLDHFAEWWSDDLNLGLDRGMPTKLKIEWSTSTLVWRKLVGDPLLATISTIEFHDVANEPPLDDFARVLLDPTARRLATVASVPADYGKQLVKLLGGRWRAQGKQLVRT